ncbi:MAG TPA: hypothetical protein VG275_07135 [Solirubrobacteraceae bacterium]|jgi:hypothetical protein|nr:hypothetical protein [Solirubrobacteraceae bacterium]
MPAPKPKRFIRPDLQSAYEDGFRQEYGHDSFALLERFSHLHEDAPSAAAGCERMAAMLEGAADALRSLAQAQRDAVPLHRAIDREDP